MITVPMAMAASPGPLLHPLYSDGAVLQRDVPVTVRGWTSPDAEVAVTLSSEKLSEQYRARADDAGAWRLQLRAHAAGENYQLRAESGGRSSTAAHLCFGDVWLCSGQSNMAMVLKNTDDGTKVAAQADYANLRVFTLPMTMKVDAQALPPESVKWAAVTPATAGALSAVAFYFGRHWQEQTKVPVGLLISTVGGTSVDVWLPAEALRELPASRDEVLAFEKDRRAMSAVTTSLTEDLEAWCRKFDPGSKPSQTWADPGLADDGWATMRVPGRWWKEPFHHFLGVVWFRKTVVLTKEQAAQAATLGMEFPREFDTAFVNGVQVGAGTNRVISRHYSVPVGVLREGANVIAVRLIGIDANGGFGHMAEHFKLEFESGAAPVALAGDWHVKQGGALAGAAPLPTRLDRSPDRVTLLYNGMIAPLQPCALRGFVWYQGENDVARSDRYPELLESLITSWRHGFDTGEAPFVVVQLPTYDSDGARRENWAEMREAQRRAVKATPGSALAVAWDTGSKENIHPTDNKSVIGRRAAEAALALAGLPGGALAPEPVAAVRQGNDVIVKFSHAGDGLRARDGAALRGFEAAGTDGKFVRVEATVAGATEVRLKTGGAAGVRLVRFAWADAPDANLCGGDGFPATPFVLEVKP